MRRTGFAVILLLATSLAPATPGIITGKVQYIRSFDTTHSSGQWAPPVYWFSIEGVSSGDMGSCGAHAGVILLVMRTDQSYSMVLAAQMAGKEITVYYDDAVRFPNATNFCVPRYITLGGPAPQF